MLSVTEVVLTAVVALVQDIMYVYYVVDLSRRSLIKVEDETG
jgi:hypothetical protein